MNNLNGISIVICTRNRPDDLGKCLISITKQRQAPKAEVIIIDDGDLPDSVICKWRALLIQYDFQYVKKEEPGLFLSRITALTYVSRDIILFLDDDVELQCDYLERLYKAYQLGPDVVGMCGVDQNLKRPGFLAWLYNSVFLLKSTRPGRLSPTGYGVSMKYWKDQHDCFETQFLSGCNMSFRTQVIQSLNLKPVHWLKSYSLGEDMYLTYYAGIAGKIMVNPSLKLWHNQSEVSRDKLEVLAFSEIVNHRYLLSIRDAKVWQYGLQFWTGIGLLIKSVLTFNFQKTKGYLKGMGIILNWKRSSRC